MYTTLRDDLITISESLIIGRNVSSVSDPLGVLVGLGDLDDELDSVLLDAFEVGKALDDLKSRSHEELGSGGDHAAFALDAASVLVRVALFDDELALGVVDDHVVLVRLLLRHDLLALEIPVAFGVRVFDFALDLAAHAFVAFELLWQALGELERWLFYVQVARCLFVLVDHARVLAFVLFNVL